MGRDNVDGTVGLEFHDAVALGIKREIISLPDMKARAELAAALADDDAPGPHKLAAVDLDAEPLGIGVASVGGTALTFSMRHDDFLE